MLNKKMGNMNHPNSKLDKANGTATNEVGRGNNTSTSAPAIKRPDSFANNMSPEKVGNGLPSGRKQHTLKKFDQKAFPNNPRLNDNLRFYRNEISSRPFPGNKLNEMLKWKGDYHKLEREHQYIQWLFPLPEGSGLNMSAQALQEHEALEIQSCKQTKTRVLRAYVMMLDFYGMKLESSETGEVARADNYKERFQHLNRSMHNYRRITRIIKSLGCLGYGHLQAPWVKFIIEEAVYRRALPKLDSPSMYHWIDAIVDTKQREKMMAYFHTLKEGSPVDSTNFEVSNGDEYMDCDVDTGHFQNECGVKEISSSVDRNCVGTNSDSCAGPSSIDSFPSDYVCQTATSSVNYVRANFDGCAGPSSIDSFPSDYFGQTATSSVNYVRANSVGTSSESSVNSTMRVPVVSSFVSPGTNIADPADTAKRHVKTSDSVW